MKYDTWESYEIPNCPTMLTMAAPGLAQPGKASSIWKYSVSSFKTTPKRYNKKETNDGEKE